MSRFLARAATTAACVAIVLLIALLVLLWTGVRSGSISTKLTHPGIRNETVNSQGHGSYEEPARTIPSQSSIMFDRLQHRFDVKPKTSWELENATNGGGRPYKVAKLPGDGHGINQHLSNSVLLPTGYVLELHNGPHRC